MKTGDTAYSRLTEIKNEYDEMYAQLQCVLGIVSFVAESPTKATKVDWKSVKEQIERLKVFNDSN